MRAPALREQVEGRGIVAGGMTPRMRFFSSFSSLTRGYSHRFEASTLAFQNVTASATAARASLMPGAGPSLSSSGAASSSSSSAR